MYIVATLLIYRSSGNFRVRNFVRKILMLKYFCSQPWPTKIFNNKNYTHRIHLYSWIRGYHLYIRKYGRHAADVEEIPRERAIVRDGKLPVKDPFISGSLITGLK